jgi:hypothetical protein
MINITKFINIFNDFQILFIKNKCADLNDPKAQDTSTNH